MSLSLVPAYASSDSDSDTEELKDEKRQIPPASRELGAKLASVLPPPKNRATAADSGKVRIVVDLGQAQSKPSTSDLDSLPPVANSGDGPAKRPSGGLLSELLSVLPAPKNSRLGATAVTGLESSSGGSIDRAATKHAPNPTPPTAQPLVPHSISSKRRGKLAATLAKGKAVANVATQSCEVDDDSGSEPDTVDDVAANPLAGNSSPFFTIGGADAESGVGEPNGGVVDFSENGKDGSGTAPLGQEQFVASELHYDPNSGYYYSYASERFYYYDADSGEYIDAQSLYPHGDQELESGDPGNTDYLSEKSRIDQLELQRLIGRGVLKRGEMHEITSAKIKDVSQSAQLRNSGYSDAQMAQELSLKRSAEQQRHESKHIIVGDETEKRKKKSKNNIMYLALQAQEQEAKLKDAHANRQRAKKAARAKYGY
ncbi:hypothetical protein GGI20_001506 [Coemansia sp. BCRC 34301]|nr:hypothetical protein GGI20_001506 [Coemansia sp. BCRC 34301]